MNKYWGSLLCSPLLVVHSFHAIAEEPIDVVLIGGGIMSATLGSYLQQLEPDWSLHLYERLDGVAKENSYGWNNAGTGHSSFCELNYTPEREDGSVTIDRAIDISEQFEVSRQFYASQVERGALQDPSSFIQTAPHLSFVQTERDVEFLRERYNTMSPNPHYADMEYTEDREQIAEWAPLLMEGREDDGTPLAATRMQMGTEINWGEQTRQLIDALEQDDNFTLSVNSEVVGLDRNEEEGTWRVTIENMTSGEEHHVNARHVFIGAGGAALNVLQLANIPEAEGYAALPASGQFLYTSNPDVVSRHRIKVYGSDGEGSPETTVPHLDIRYLDGEEQLFFGPFLSITTRFLQEGSWTDLFESITFDNTLPLLGAIANNHTLATYMIGQWAMTESGRMDALREFYPEANPDDWELWEAGYLVQVVKEDEDGADIEFGTQIVVSEDQTLSALLGESPGASTAPSIMLDVLERTFPEQIQSESWVSTLTDIIPTYGQRLEDDPDLLKRTRAHTAKILQLDEPLNLAAAESLEDSPAGQKGEEDEEDNDAA